MKKNKFLILFLTLILLLITGCGNNNKPNQNVGILKLYIPTDYKVRNDLRGMLYNDNTRKVFAKGDTTDYSTFMYIDIIKQTFDDLDKYIIDVNNNLKENDVKFIKKEHNLFKVYGRDGYLTQQSETSIINYAYLVNIDNVNFLITISGPNNNKIEIENLSQKVLLSLQKQES